MHFFKAAGCLFALFCLLIVGDDAISLVLEDKFVPGYDEVRLLLASSTLAALYQLFMYLSQVLIFVSLISLGFGILLAGGIDTSPRLRIFELVCYGALIAVGILSVAYWATIMSIRVPLYRLTLNDDDDDEVDGNTDETRFDRLLFHCNAAFQLEFAIQVLLVVLALVASARTIQVWKQVNSAASRSNKTSLIYLTACCILYLVLTVFHMSITAAYSDLQDFDNDMSIQSPALFYIDILLIHWAQFVLSVLQFVLAVKKADGVWSGDGAVDKAVETQPKYH